MSASSPKILVLGYFGYCKDQIDGQTIKTRNIYKLLSEECSNYFVTFFDTEQYKQTKLSILKTAWLLFKSDICVYLPGENNLSYLFPIFFVLSKLFHTKIIYPVVGGWLADFLSSHKLHLVMLRNISVLLVESRELRGILSTRFQLHNVELFPNFRIHDFTPVIKHRKKTFTLVFMGRIIVEKGIDVIFRFMDYAIERGYSDKLSCIFYGPIIDDIFFTEKIKKYTNMSYGGILNDGEIYSALSVCDLMLLPTRYKGEGFPGSIIDAYISGIPVICSNWKFLKECVVTGKTGYIYDLDDEYLLYHHIFTLMDNDNLLLEMKQNAVRESMKYSTKEAWRILSKYVEIQK